MKRVEQKKMKICSTCKNKNKSSQHLLYTTTTPSLTVFKYIRSFAQTLLYDSKTTRKTLIS